MSIEGQHGERLSARRASAVDGGGSNYKHITPLG